MSAHRIVSRPRSAPAPARSRGARRASGLILAVGLLVGGNLVQAGVIDLTWDARGHFDYTGAIDAGGMLEICGPLVHGERIAWRFDSSAALPANVHYHVDEQVTYPARHAPLATLHATLDVPVDQTYCWMWENAGTEGVRITVGLERLPPGG